MLIRQCDEADVQTVYTLVNHAAHAYKGVIPDDCWHEPYMPEDELRGELEAGVVFWGFEEDATLVGVMGIQDVKDVTLIRHAYVDPEFQRKGVGGALLEHLLGLTDRPVLVGTWADAHWAIRFYERHHFELVHTLEEKDRLLESYWTVPPRQRQVSVVLRQRLP